MSTCDWEGCTTAALPIATSTGHHLCPLHLAQATAVVRDATRRLGAIPADVVMAEPKTKRPLGRKVPPIIFALVVLCTLVFPFRWPLSHLAFAFIMVLVIVAWWGWIWGFGKPTR